MHTSMVLVLVSLNGLLCKPNNVEDPGDPPLILNENSPAVSVRSYGPFLEYLNPFSWFEYDDVETTSAPVPVNKDQALYNVVKCLTLEEGEKCKSLLTMAEKFFKGPENESVNAPHDPVELGTPDPNRVPRPDLNSRTSKVPLIQRPNGTTQRNNPASSNAPASSEVSSMAPSAATADPPRGGGTPGLTQPSTNSDNGSSTLAAVSSTAAPSPST